MELPAAGLLLLTGGASRRYGAPKHLQLHPDGGDWGSHLLDVHGQALGPGPVRILGPGLPGHPDLPSLPDDGRGPALALAAWARSERAACRRWWVAPCDQPRWTVASLRTWHSLAAEADPGGEAWVAAETGGRIQCLGGFLGAALLPALGKSTETRLQALWEQLPHRLLPWEGEDFDDLDDRGAYEAWIRSR